MDFLIEIALFVFYLTLLYVFFEHLTFIFWDGRGVGFLRYFRFEQLPNFLLASPILSLAFFSIVHYGKSRPKLLLSVGFQATAEDRNSAAMLYFPERVPRPSMPRHMVASSSGLQGIAYYVMVMLQFFVLF